MSFGGAIDTMIRSYQSNVGWLRKKRLSDQNLLYKNSNKQVETKPMNEEQKQWVKDYIKKYKRQELVRRIIIITITIVAIAVILYFTLNADYSGLKEILT